MATTTPFKYAQNTTKVVSGIATIDSGETASLPIVCAGHSVVRLTFPTMTGTTVTFTVKPFPSGSMRQTSGALDGTMVDFDPPYTELVDRDGTAVTYTAADGKNTFVAELTGAYAFTIVSSGAEAAAREIFVSMTGDSPVIMATEVDVNIESGATISVSAITSATSNGYGTQTAVTRPANQTPYTANDVVGGAIDLGIMGPSASQIIITSALLEPRIAAVPAGMTSFTLYLYSVTPPSAIADNGAWTLATADLASYLGQIALGTPALPAASSNALIVEQANLGKQVKLAGTHLFAYLVTAGGYTPAANSEVYVIGAQSVAV